MTRGARIFLVVLVLLFAAMGCYYLLIPASDAPESAMPPQIAEPTADEADSKATTAPEAISSGVSLSTNTFAARVAVRSSNPRNVDLVNLRERLKLFGPIDGGSGVAGWYAVQDLALFCESDDMVRAANTDPMGFFQDRYGLVAQASEGRVWMLLYTLPGRSLNSTVGHRISVVSVDRRAGDGVRGPTVAVALDVVDAERLRQFSTKNNSNPCAILVNDLVVSVPMLRGPIDGPFVLSGSAASEQVADALRGETVLSAALILSEDQLPQASSKNDVLLAGSVSVVRDPVVDATEVEKPVKTETVRTVNTPAVPKASTPKTPRIPAPKVERYQVKPGDTLSSIAESWFGDPNRWSAIVEANPGMNPNRLKIGQLLRMPSKTASAPATVVSSIGRTWTVRSGDSLSSIATRFFGTSRNWRAIYEANKAAIGSDPAALKVGMTLQIPTG